MWHKDFTATINFMKLLTSERHISLSLSLSKATNIWCNFKSIDTIFNIVCNFFRVHSEISQFIDGLNRVGNFHTSAILRAAKEFKTLFTPNPVNHLTFSGLRQMYKIEFSPVGSNHLQQEDQAIYCFESFCSDCEGRFML